MPDGKEGEGGASECVDWEGEWREGAVVNEDC